MSPDVEPITTPDVEPITTPDVEWIDEVFTGTVCWGHVTGVTEDNTRTFTADWTGDGAISGAGDAEIITLDAGKYMDSITWEMGVGTVILDDDKYGVTTGTRTLQYKEGTTEANCNADTWHDYTTPFATSGEGWVKVKVKNP